MKLAGMSVIATLGMALSTSGQDWGPLKDYVAPASAETYTALVSLTTAATALGIPAPMIAGGPGGMTMNGVTVWEFDVSDLDSNWAGYATYEWDGEEFKTGIAFDMTCFTDFAFVDPIDPRMLAELNDICWHELAHIEWYASLAYWCDNDPDACDDYHECISNLTDADGNSKGYSEDTGDPCTEAFANDASLSMLCAAKVVVCQSGSLTEHQKVSMLAALERQIQLALSRCETYASDCASCSGPPMPQGYSHCSPPLCTCN